MAKNFYTNIDLKQNQLLNALIHPTGTAPAGAKGQVYYNDGSVTAADQGLYVFDGTNWAKLAQGKVEKNQITIDGKSLDDIARWSGAWAASTEYAVGDIISYAIAPKDGVYICTTAHTSGANFDDTEMGKFLVLGGGHVVKDVKVRLADGTTEESIVDFTTDKEAVIKFKGEDLKFNTTSKEIEVVNRTFRETTLVTGVKSLVSNNPGDEGACLKIEDTATANKGMAAVAVNNGTIGAQIYNIQGTGATDKAVIIDVTKDKAYYYTGTFKAAADRDDAKNEIATIGRTAVTIDEFNSTTTTTPTSGSKVTYKVKQDGTTLDKNLEIPNMYVKEKTPTGASAILKQYEFYYGVNPDETTGATPVTTIDIPKDFLLKAAYADKATAFSTTKADYKRGEIVVENDDNTTQDLYVVKTDATGVYANFAAFKANAIKTNYTGQRNHKYLVLWTNVEGGSVTEADQLTLIDVTDLAPIYTADDGIKLDGTVFKHTNAVTAVTTAIVPKVTYDAQGHITASTDFTPRLTTKNTADLDGAGGVKTCTITLPTGAEFDRAYCKDTDGNEAICDISVVGQAVTFSVVNNFSLAGGVPCFVRYFGEPMTP